MSDILIEKIRAAVFGLAISDAMGVPVEFIDREELCSEPDRKSVV